jgi:hypothetical protein
MTPRMEQVSRLGCYFCKAVETEDKPQTVELITAMGECMTGGSSGAGILKLRKAGSNKEAHRNDWETRVFEE